MVTDGVTALFCNFTVSFHPCIVKEYKTVLDQFGFYAVHSGFLDNGNWIPGFNCLLDSGFLELNYRLQCSGFRIPPALKNFVDSGKSGLL